MRLFFIFCIVLLNGVIVFSQDGSDMVYLKPESLDASHVGRRLHLDFYRRSARGRRRPDSGGINVDKVSLEINGRVFEFVEHRFDDGFNNWFSQQYLETADKKVRLREFKLLEVGKERIVVIGYFNIAPGEHKFTFEKTDIAEVLLKVTGK